MNLSEVFYKPIDLSPEEYDDSALAGVEKLLKAESYKDCLIGNSVEFDEADELYYFIVDNGNIKEEHNDLRLYELDEKLFVLFDSYEEDNFSNFVIFHKKDINYVKDQFQ